MNDKELADKVVARGVGEYAPYECLEGGSLRSDDKYYYNGIYHTATGLVRDWRVAGALMEKLDEVHYRYIEDDEGAAWSVFVDETAILTGGPLPRAIIEARGPLPRAIIEACVEALE